MVGQERNGDRALILEDAGVFWFIVIDGLGHGPLAADAADRACEVLEKLGPHREHLELFLAVHTALRSTRGCAMTAVRFRQYQLSAAGVGNVALSTDGFRFSFVPTAGVLGSTYRKLVVQETQLTGPVRIALHSDGLPSLLRLEDYRAYSPELLCEHLLERTARPTDDATVLVAELSPSL